ncbi:KilA-N domain-containing protein [Burkholderia contaminans]|uniref:KilA-N domain-containing protein n=1 Tax=Burkholderia contaminans TaxID=488447 RepID=UPI0014530D8A|nr:KilA-N domain-containing protein [Burkholderia contaminans]VWD15225.1 KilA domain-containing protein [Burkholderia contaminans]
MQALAIPRDSFTIGTFNIRTVDGLFSLNDLHKASGGAAKHQPALFIRLDQTRALIAEIECSTEMQNTAVRAIRGNRADGMPQGTYACRELVIAYAAWISPAFHLNVIRVFLGATPQVTQQSLPLTAIPDGRPSVDFLQALAEKGRYEMTVLANGAVAFVPVAEDAIIVTESQLPKMLAQEGVCRHQLSEILAVVAGRITSIGKRHDC